MRTLLAALALTISLPAAADTITLPPVVCGTARICKSAGIEIRANTMYPDVAVLIGDETYTSPIGGQKGADGTFDHIGPLVLNFGAKHIILTAEFSSHRKPATGILRAVTIWTLESATVERP